MQNEKNPDKLPTQEIDVEQETDAEHMELCRKREAAVCRLQKEWTEAALWDAVIAFQNYPFHTVSGLPFSYELKTGRDGSYNKELVINRRKESKSLVWSSVTLAFQNAANRKGEVIIRPKALGDIRGISYIYPMFARFGIIAVQNT
jgi:hypothetical protein